jgi:hypothetical protein
MIEIRAQRELCRDAVAIASLIAACRQNLPIVLFFCKSLAITASLLEHLLKQSVVDIRPVHLRVT